MMELKDILGAFSQEKKVRGSGNPVIRSLQFDSRKIENDSLFFAIKGTQTDGHDYIVKAIENGAVAIVCEILPDELTDTVVWVKVGDAQIALAEMAAAFYGHPSKSLALIGVTGTNGKTTIVTLLYNLFRQLGKKVGLISTINYRVGDKIYPSSHTTPDPLNLQRLLREMVDQGCSHAFMEVSSHAMVQNRVDGVHFSGGIFTNLSHDHLDYHGSFDAYLKAKKSFFDMLPKTAFALSNIDDKRGRVMLQNTAASIQTYSQSRPSDFRVKVIENGFDGMLLEIDGDQIFCRLIGDFNADNLLAIYACAILLEMDKMEVLTAMTNLNSAEGRFDYIRQEAKNITGVVDYAHTPDALEKLLQTISKIRRKAQRIITVVGCGGDRDKTKRPVMARVACQYSDQVIFTSDNPRTEDPHGILADMIAGIEEKDEEIVLEIENRREAIKTATRLAKTGDIIVIAGKGHEPYQEINGVRHEFNDKEILTAALKIEKVY